MGRRERRPYHSDRGLIMNTRTWVTLLMLTALGFLASEGMGRSVALLILAASGAKCSLLGWRFMELRRAHWLWSTTLFTLLSAFLVTVGWLRRD